MQVSFDVGILAKEVEQLCDPAAAHPIGHAYFTGLSGSVASETTITLNDANADKPSVILLQLEGDFKKALSTGAIMNSAEDLAQLLDSDNITFAFKSPTLLQVCCDQDRGRAVLQNCTVSVCFVFFSTEQSFWSLMAVTNGGTDADAGSLCLPPLHSRRG